MVFNYLQWGAWVEKPICLSGLPLSRFPIGVAVLGAAHVVASQGHIDLVWECQELHKQSSMWGKALRGASNYP